MGVFCTHNRGHLILSHIVYYSVDICMYHVTKETINPNWSTIKACSIANDETYDGDLLGLPLASFTTTQNEYMGKIKLPTISPYPRNIGRVVYTGSYRRVKIRFKMNDYHIFLMGKSSTSINNKISQIQLLCIRRSDNDRDQFEDEVYGILLKYYKDKKLTEQSLKKYFPDRQANVYKGQSRNEADRMFVNVHFTYDVDISVGVEWDTVSKLGGTGTGKIDHRFDDIKLDDLRSLWCMKHHFKTLNDKIIQLEDKKYETWKIMKPAQSALRKTFDQWENELIHKLGQMHTND